MSGPDNQEQREDVRASRPRYVGLTGHAAAPDGRFPRFHDAQSPDPHSPSQERAPPSSRDFADQVSSTSPTLQKLRSSEVSQPPPGIRRRPGSAQPSPSPNPSQYWRGFAESSRRSVAIAAPSRRGSDTVSRKFSLAGPATIDTLVANQPYVDPGYAQLNPAYEQPANVRPVWGLAKPLPHVLRPGMVPTREELRDELKDRQEEQDQTDASVDIESGRIDPTLRPDRITPHLDEIRRDRENQMLEAFYQQHQLSPGISPFGRARKVSSAGTEIPGSQFGARRTIFEEEEEQYQHGGDREFEQQTSNPDLSNLSEAIANVSRAKEAEETALGYQDAIPLPAYEAENDEVHNLHTYWSVVRLQFREPLAELLAIMVQFTLGFSTNLSMTVSRGAAGVGDTGDWGWGLATMVAIYIAGGISGAHLNPAISVMLYIYRGFPLRKVPTYIVAQVLGAFLATLITFSIFQPGLLAVQANQDLLIQQPLHPVSQQPVLVPSPPAILANFITFPRTGWVDIRTAFLTELTGTTILTISVLALGDDTNAPPGAGMNAFIIGLVVTVLGMALGYNTGLAMNPARDFGPRIALALLGYGRGQWSPSLFSDGYWFHVAWLGPFTGAILGGFIYDTMIFVGGESPVNYPAKRIKRATIKWKRRWGARMARKKRKVKDVSDRLTRSD